ncbi:MAG: hypothetical protein ACLP01_33085 [Solirubrobacteraceae bacterium]
MASSGINIDFDNGLIRVERSWDPVKGPVDVKTDWKQISTWAGHGDVRQTWNRYGHLVPGGEEQARERRDAYLTLPTPITNEAHDPPERRNPRIDGVSGVPLPGFEAARSGSDLTRYGWK